MIKDQIITVTNKAQLLAAFGCAIGFPHTTRITLIRKSGKTFYILRSFSDSEYSIGDFDILIRRARAKIRSTPAEYFK